MTQYTEDTHSEKSREPDAARRLSAASALATISPADVDTRQLMGRVVKANLGTDGFEIWDSWSQDIEDYSPIDSRQSWDRFQDGSRKLPIALLYKRAKTSGWQGRTGQHSDRERRRRARQRRKARERALHAAELAQEMIDNADLRPHPYLASKGFPDRRGYVATTEYVIGSSRAVREGDLLVPMCRMNPDGWGELVSIQIIYNSGEKRYLPGSRVKGAAYLLRNGPAGYTWLCEGFATGLSVVAALDQLGRQDRVVVCFSAANISRVYRRLEQAGRNGSARVVADHDLYTCSRQACHHRWDAQFDLPHPRCPQCGADKVARPAGEQAAVRTGLPYWLPKDPGMDANDVHQQHGLDALANTILDLFNQNLPGRVYTKPAS